MKKCQGLPLLLARVILGTAFVSAGMAKFHDLHKTIAYFQSIGIWAAKCQAPFVATVEVTCGAFLLIGFLTRYVAMPLSIIMIVALSTAHAEHIKSVIDFLTNQDTAYLALLAFLIIFGGGFLSVDRLIWKDPFGENR